MNKVLKQPPSATNDPQKSDSVLKFPQEHGSNSLKIPTDLQEKGAYYTTLSEKSRISNGMYRKNGAVTKQTKHMKQKP